MFKLLTKLRKLAAVSEMHLSFFRCWTWCVSQTAVFLLCPLWLSMVMSRTCYFLLVIYVAIPYGLWGSYTPWFIWPVCLCSTKPRDWLGRTFLKWPILCQIGRTTWTQSIN